MKQRIVILTLAFSLLGLRAFGQNVVRVQVGTASVDVSSFDTGWAYAMAAPEATVTLLKDITRTSKIVYQPKVADGRHTLDLNGHKITNNTGDRLLTIYKEDAKLTIVDNSASQSGCLYKKQSSDTVIYAVVVDRGELELAGGTIYCENTYDDAEWHPAVGIYSQRGNGAKVTISGGQVESVAKTTAYAVYSYGKLHMTGGTLRATETKYKGKNAGARALTQYLDTADISGGTLEVFAKDSSSYAYTVVASSWVSSESGQFKNGVVNITGGTFTAQSDSGSVNVLRADAKTVQAGGQIIRSNGVFNVSGGTFTARCTYPLVTQLFCGFVSGDRLFDDATPHHLLGESLGEMNISGGTFLIDTRDGDTYCGAGDVDLFRSWGSLTISGGDFTLHTKQGAGVGVYRGKAVLSGNPVFTIHAQENARGLVASPWNSSNYCDADASKNLSEIEVSGGTYIIDNLSEEGAATGIWASGGISSASSTAESGYAMSAKITVTGGEVITVHPKGDNSRPLRQNAPKTGTHGTANADLIIRGGKFKALTGTLASNEPTGKNVDPNSAIELTELSSGYFATYSELAMHADDTCTIVPIDDTDPEYNNGYRYTIAAGPAVAQVTAGEDTKSFSMLQSAIRYALKQPEALVTLTHDDTFYGPFTLTPKIANCHVTVDVNNRTVTGITLTDRFLVTNKAGLKLTLTDNSADKNGEWHFSSDIKNTLYALMVMSGEAELKGGTLRVTNRRSGYTASACYARTNGKASVHDGFHIQAPRGVQLDPASLGVTIYGGKFECTTNINGTSATNLAVQGGYYVNDSQLEATVKSPYRVQPTTEEDKATVGSIYNYKVELLPETGPYLDIIDVDNTNHTLTINTSNWDLSGWPYNINHIAYSKEKDRAADQTMKIAYTGEPGEKFYVLIRKYSETGKIYSHHVYVIPQEVTSDSSISTDQDRNLFIKNGANLMVDGNLTAQKIYVAPDAKLTINSGKTLTAEAVYLRTIPDAAAELDNAGSLVGPVYYTRIVASKDDYYPFGLPLNCALDAVSLSNGAPINYLSGSGWLLRSYSESQCAASGVYYSNWETFPKGSTIAGGAGYELFSGASYYREFYFPVNLNDLTDHVAVNYDLGTAGAPHAGWNMLVSPLTQAYSTTPVPEGTVVGWKLPDGTFAQEIPSVIPPATFFAYQASESGYLSFAGSSLAAPKPHLRAATEEEKRVQWVQLDMTNAAGEGDQTTIYSHPKRYNQNYQTGIDVTKLSLEASRPILYSSLAYGDMAFAGITDVMLEQGVALTIYSPKPQEMTISLRDNGWLDRLVELWLIDNQTGAQTDLLTSDYTFEANEGTTRGRLVLAALVYAPEDIGNVGFEDEHSALKGAQKVIIGDKLYIRINGQIYDATGRRVE